MLHYIVCQRSLAPFYIVSIGSRLLNTSSAYGTYPTKEKANFWRAILNRSSQNKSKVKYSTSYAGIGGFKPGHNPPKEMKKMLTNYY